MNDEKFNNNSDSLLEELKNLNKDLKNELQKDKETYSTITASDSAQPNGDQLLTEAKLSEFILENSQKLIKNGLETIMSLKDIVASTADGKAMSGLAEIIKATTGALDTLNSINVEQRKINAAKEIKIMDIEARKKIGPPSKTTNNLNVIASRELMMNMLEEINQKTTAVDAEFVEVPTPQVPATNTPPETPQSPVNT